MTQIFKGCYSQRMTRQILKQSGGHVASSCFKAMLTFGIATQEVEGSGTANCTVTRCTSGICHFNHTEPGLGKKSLEEENMKFFQGSDGHRFYHVWKWQDWTTFTYKDGSTKHITEWKTRKLILKYWCNNPSASLNQNNGSI